MVKTQIIIIGGGLAGLTSAIHLSRKGIEVILIEKEEYPHHKVCGEYLSREVIPYLNSIGVHLEELRAPEISRLQYSSVSGKRVYADLQLGGLGISRFSLDNYLFEKAKSYGCQYIHDSVKDVEFENGNFKVSLLSGDIYQSDFVLGAYGKRSNLDKKLNRDFIKEQSEWLAVKSHYKSEDYPENLVSLHNFKRGYCGLSMTDLGTVNVCYLATYKSFKAFKNTEEFKSRVLMKNPRLSEFFKKSKPVFENELTIAQVCFDKKSLIEDHAIMIGDAAGLIHPLCGNGMAMAMHSAKIASETVLGFYQESISRADLEMNYKKVWKKTFNSRIAAGRLLQKILLNNSLSEISQNIIGNIPGIMPYIVKSTHGNPIYV